MNANEVVAALHKNHSKLLETDLFEYVNTRVKFAKNNRNENIVSLILLQIILILFAIFHLMFNFNFILIFSIIRFLLISKLRRKEFHN